MNLLAYVNKAGAIFWSLIDPDSGEVVASNADPLEDKTVYQVGAVTAVAGPTPTLAEVLAEGNDPAGTEVHAADDGDGLGALLALAAGQDGVQGGPATLTAGASGATLGASVVVGPAYVSGEATVAGTVAVTTGGAGQTGTSGQALVSGGGGDFSGQVLWGGVQVTSGAPTLAPDGKLPIYLDSGSANDLYIWDGSAWQGPYNVGT